MVNARGRRKPARRGFQFDRSVKLALQGCLIRSDGGLPLHRELDDAPGLTDMAARLVADLAPAGMGVIALRVFYDSPSSPVPAGTRTSTMPTGHGAIR